MAFWPRHAGRIGGILLWIVNVFGHSLSPDQKQTDVDMTKAPKSAKPAANPAKVARPARASKAAPKPAAPKPAPKPRASATATAAITTPKPPVAEPRPIVRAKVAPAERATQAHVPALRKKEFLQRILTVTGAKKKDAQGIVEATLKVLGDALSSGESLALPGLGKARVGRQVDQTGGEMLVVKLRRGGAPKPGVAKKNADETLAEADE